MKNIMARRHRHIHTKLVVAVAFAIWLGGAAHAFVIDTGNPDIDMRWDNSIRYNAGMRMEGLNPDFANSFGNDETENSVKKHRMVTNRVDLLSELEFVYKRDYGARVSAALWSEQAYSSHVKTSPLIDSTYGGTVPANMSASKTYSAYAKRYLTGDSGEILDAFVFGAVDLGPTTLRLKAGQHNIYWGESLYTVGDGIATGQGR